MTRGKLHRLTANRSRGCIIGLLPVRIRLEFRNWWMIRQIYWVRPESCRSTVGSSPAPPSKSLINVGKNSYRPVLRECPRFDGVPAIALEMHIQDIIKWLSVLQIWVGARILNTVRYDSRQHTVRGYCKPTSKPSKLCGGVAVCKTVGDGSTPSLGSTKRPAKKGL